MEQDPVIGTSVLKVSHLFDGPVRKVGQSL